MEGSREKNFEKIFLPPLSSPRQRGNLPPSPEQGAPEAGGWRAGEAAAKTLPPEKFRPTDRGRNFSVREGQPQSGQKGTPSPIFPPRGIPEGLWGYGAPQWDGDRQKATPGLCSPSGRGRAREQSPGPPEGGKGIFHRNRGESGERGKIRDGEKVTSWQGADPSRKPRPCVDWIGAARNQLRAFVPRPGGYRRQTGASRLK